MSVDTSEARQRLERLRDELDQSIGSLTAGVAEESSELSSYDQHSADAASDLVDGDREEAMREVVEAQRAEVLEALARVEAGTYGTCVVCDTALPPERLEARPEAARCLSCQNELEHTR